MKLLKINIFFHNDKIDIMAIMIIRYHLEVYPYFKIVYQLIKLCIPFLNRFSCLFVLSELAVSSVETFHKKIIYESFDQFNEQESNVKCIEKLKKTK